MATNLSLSAAAVAAACLLTALALESQTVTSSLLVNTTQK